MFDVKSLARITTLHHLSNQLRTRDGRTVSRTVVGRPLVPGTVVHRLAGRFPRRLAVRSADSVQRLHRTAEGSLRIAAEDRSTAAVLRRKHGPDEGVRQLEQKKNRHVTEWVGELLRKKIKELTGANFSYKLFIYSSYRCIEQLYRQCTNACCFDVAVGVV